ncbi:MAG: formylglycine-generating enzyme family protein [Pirellulales bacterium]|nr:formylglycine-generating enzyme family protein [Pirellulales bacterium]
MATLCVLTMVLSSAAHSASALAANPQDGRKGGSEAKAVSQIRVDNASDATTEEDMRPYTDQINGTKVTFDMVPIRGGKFLMGSPDSEADRSDAEGPQHEVEIASFWMGKHEVTWDEYNIYTFSLDIKRREVFNLEATEGDLLADAVAHPTKPYVDMSFGMGKDGFPAVCMTQYAAKKYCEWLSAKTGHYYRLPTEAEWEYACRAGTTTAYSFGGGTDNIDEYAWHLDNSGEKYHKVGEKKPNPWGLFDMHGNVSEWVLDAFDPSYYGKLQGVTSNPLNQPTQEYSRTVRGGSWDDFPEDLRSSVRKVSEPLWKERDPQDPQSIWYLTDAPFVGFRIVRPLVEPSDDEKKKYGPDKYQDGS